MPHSFVNNGYKGYLEDRRPNSPGDPYRIAGRIIESIEAVPLPGESLAELAAGNGSPHRENRPLVVSEPAVG